MARMSRPRKLGTEVGGLDVIEAVMVGEVLPDCRTDAVVDVMDVTMLSVAARTRETPPSPATKALIPPSPPPPDRSEEGSWESTSRSAMATSG